MEHALKIVLLVTGLFFVASTSLAQTGSGYELSWWTVDGGGHEMSSGDYRLVGTAGQPDAYGLTGGGYTLAGGFWGGGSLTMGYDIYLPLVLRSH